MHRLMVLLVIVALGGCMKVSDLALGARDHMSDAGLLDHSETRRANTWRLQADSLIYIAQSAFMPENGTHTRPNVVAEEAFRGFVEYFPMIRRARQPVSLEQAMSEARAVGANYLLYTRFADADDRIGTLEEWEDQEAVDRLGVDNGVIQLMLIETNTRYLVDTARITNRGGLFTFYDQKPEDLIGPPLREYARSLLGLSR